MTLFYPSNFSLYKNHLVLIKSLLEANSAIKDSRYTLVLTGDKSNLSKECIQLIDDNNLPIVFVGKLSKLQMKEWYSQSILVFPSYLETVGIPLAEAKSMGCKIFASDCEYSHETIGNYDSAFYFNPFSVDELKKLLVRNAEENIIDNQGE